MIYLVAQAFGNPYEYQWCNRLAFSWTCFSVVTLFCALLFGRKTMSGQVAEAYGWCLIGVCAFSCLVAAYTVRLEVMRRMDRARIQLREGVDTRQRERAEKGLMRAVFGQAIGERLWRRNRGVDAHTRSGVHECM